MKSTLRMLGVGALICLPCLAIAFGVGGLVSAGAILAFAQQPLVQTAGAVAGLAGLAVVAKSLPRRERNCRECEVERARGAGPDRVRHESHT